ncbi:AbrB/MazE/SpoVT family DNA-binding domain-containing protein [Archangium gephyra]|uniref:AbrB/MazE/SpoVT family DNA-binding domain-containing protein n=1 Tax=Archangium gephyra TaxID=48 RepID=UPI003B7ACF86
MTKTLTSIGNSLGLIIDKPILELLRIDKDTPLEARDGWADAHHPARARQERGAAFTGSRGHREDDGRT